jgi:membrane-associated phospholipid phosphatase
MQLKAVMIALACLHGLPSAAIAQALATDSERSSCPATAGSALEDGGSTSTAPRCILRDILRDQANIWRLPWDVAHGQHWKPVLAFTIATTAAVALDPHDAPYFRRTQTFERFGHVFSGLNTGLGEGLVPVAFLMAGLIHHDGDTEQTALLASEALADAEIVSAAVKNITRRRQPSDIPPAGEFGDTWFKAGGGVLINRGSFPSAHAIAAFALATVIAERYRQHHWVPWLAYGLAGTVGFSRVTLQSHFPSDLVAGAIWGYAIGRHVAERER